MWKAKNFKYVALKLGELPQCRVLCHIYKANNLKKV